MFVSTYEPVDGMKEFEGKLLSYSEEQLAVRVGNKTYEIPRNKVALARLAIEF